MNVTSTFKDIFVDGHFIYRNLPLLSLSVKDHIHINIGLYLYDGLLNAQSKHVGGVHYIIPISVNYPDCILADNAKKDRTASDLGVHDSNSQVEKNLSK